MTSFTAQSILHSPRSPMRRVVHVVSRVSKGPIWVIAALLLAFNVADAAETFPNGLRAYTSGDYVKAHSIWLRLAQQNDAKSQSALGYLYYSGQGVPEDRRIAAKWYHLAAMQSEPTAQSFLCELHMNGDGVRRDLELSLMWCELAIQGGELRAITFRERVMNAMTTEQRDRAWERVVKWNEGHRDHAVEGQAMR